MAKYYVNENAQANRDHEVHKQGCSYMPNQSNCRYLGDFTSCQPAVREAKNTYREADGCYYCCNECHTR